MKRMFRRAAALVIAAALLLSGAAMAASTQETQQAQTPDAVDWSRTEPGGAYVTKRVVWWQSRDLLWSDKQRITVRYQDTGELVPLMSEVYYDGYFFVTVPADRADAPLEIVMQEEHRFPDCIDVYDDGLEVHNAPVGSNRLYYLGILQGDEDGNMNENDQLTRAQAFALLVRALGLEPAGDPGYADVSPDDWYYEIASAARAAGIAAEAENFEPNRAVTRAEFTVMVARALDKLGWLNPSSRTPSQEITDLAAIPEWAQEAYDVFEDFYNLFTWIETGYDDTTGTNFYDKLAEPNKAVLRGQAVTFLADALEQMPVYPTQVAIEYGFDDGMPVIDGSTSSYPYTEALYYMLFHNADRHPQKPGQHSKSYESYERLISGEVDILFAATKPSQEQLDAAEEAGVELEFIPIAYDAMVFFTNEENSITGLTQQQIQDIYVWGKYDNWSEVGGPDAGLLPYRRNEDSGSHALMERYFLEGGKLSLSEDVTNVLTSWAMSTALTDVADAMTEDPLAYAMGYSVYYYYVNSYWLLGDSQSGRQLKLLAVDGVVPSDETIADGSYPLADYNYAVVRADEPADSLARQLADFMTTPAGQTVVQSAGFGPITPPETE